MHFLNRYFPLFPSILSFLTFAISKAQVFKGDYLPVQNDCILLKSHKLHAIKVGSRGAQYQASDLCSTKFHFLELSLGSVSEEDARNSVK